MFGFAGPQFGFNVGDKQRHHSRCSRLGNSATQTFSINLGVGATLFEHLQVTASYNVACGKTGELTLEQGVQSVVKGRNSSWQVGATYFF